MNTELYELYSNIYSYRGCINLFKFAMQITEVHSKHDRGDQEIDIYLRSYNKASKCTVGSILLKAIVNH